LIPETLFFVGNIFVSLILTLFFIFSWSSAKDDRVWCVTLTALVGGMMLIVAGIALAICASVALAITPWRRGLERFDTASGRFCFGFCCKVSFSESWQAVARNPVLHVEMIRSQTLLLTHSSAHSVPPNPARSGVDRTVVDPFHCDVSSEGVISLPTTPTGHTGLTVRAWGATCLFFLLAVLIDSNNRQTHICRLWVRCSIASLFCQPFCDCVLGTPKDLSDFTLLPKTVVGLIPDPYVGPVYHTRRHEKQ
jgi:hypothetical protein